MDSSRKRLVSKVRPLTRTPTLGPEASPNLEDELAKGTQRQAKNDAIVELELLLSDPEKLAKVSQIKLEQEEKLRASKTNLKNLVKTTLEETELGLYNLGSALEPKTGPIDEIKESYWAIKSVSEQVTQLIPKEHYQLIISADVAIYNLERTKLDLKRIIDSRKGVNEIETLLKDDEQILAVHEKVRILEKNRNQIQSGAISHGEELLSILHGVDRVSSILDQKLQQLIETHFSLVMSKQQTVLLKCLQIIHREKRIYDHEIKLREADARIKRMASTKSGLSKSTTLTKNYEEKAKEWLSKGINDKFEELTASSLNDKNEYQIQETLKCVEKDLIGHLTQVWDFVRPCFPPYLDIFGMCCQIFHKRIFDIYTQWSKFTTMSPQEIVSISRWARKKYLQRMENIGCDPAHLKPPLTTPLTPLYEVYKTQAQEAMIENALRIISVALESKASRKIQTSLYLAKHLFIFIEDHAAPVKSTKETTLIQMAIQNSLTVIELFQTKWRQALENEGTTFELWFIIALLSDFDKCRERTDTFKEHFNNLVDYQETPTFQSVTNEWTGLIQNTRSLGVDFLCNFLKDEFLTLFGPEWLLKNRDNSTGKILGTLRQDFEGTIKPLLADSPVFLLSKMATDTLDRMIVMYIAAMIRPHSFSQQTAEVMALDIQDFRALCVSVLGITEKLCTKRLSVLENLRELVAIKIEDSGEPHSILTVVQRCREEHPDMGEAIMMFIIRNRDDLDDTQIKRVGEALHKKYHSIPDPPKASLMKILTSIEWFDQITLPSSAPDTNTFFGRSWAKMIN